MWEPLNAYVALDAQLSSWHSNYVSVGVGIQTSMLNYTPAIFLCILQNN